MAGEQIRLAMVGCGGMAVAHMRGYENLKRKGVQTFAITAVCDPVEERAQDFARRAREWGDDPVVYTDLDDLLARARPDAADIATPHHLHHTTAIACMEAGVDVLIEKPLGITIRAGWLMVRAAERTGRILATAEQVRRWLGPRVLQWAINDAALTGKPRLFFALQAQSLKVDPEQRLSLRKYSWRQDRFTGGGGMIFDAGVHYADLLLYLYGEIDTVYAFTGDVAQLDWPDAEGNRHRASVEDTSIAHITTASGVRGTWTWTDAAPGQRVAHSVYYGSHGSLYGEGGYPQRAGFQRWDGEQVAWEDLARQFLDSVGEERREEYFPRTLFPDPASLSGDHGVELEVYDFLESVRTRRRPELDGLDGLKAQAVVTALMESSHGGQPVRVADVLEGRVDAFQRDINERWGL